MDLKALSDKDLTQLYLLIRCELKERKMSLKENKLKYKITNKSHNVQSPMRKLSETKARPVNKDARSIITKSKNK